MSGLRSEELATSEPSASRRAASVSGLRSEELATSDEGRRDLKGGPEASERRNHEV